MCLFDGIKLYAVCQNTDLLDDGDPFVMDMSIMEKGELFDE